MHEHTSFEPKTIDETQPSSERRPRRLFSCVAEPSDEEALRLEQEMKTIKMKMPLNPDHPDFLPYNLALSELAKRLAPNEKPQDP